MLEEILKIDGLKRVRIGSVYPDKITDKFVKLFENKNLMPHLHISLQSCDDTVLKNMRRNYGSELIRKSLLKLKNVVPDMEFTADVIVGFPKEEETMFKNTYNVIDEIEFSGLHIFPYSDREGTIASNMDGKVDAKTKKERADELGELRLIMMKKSREKYLNKFLEVLVEEEKDGEYLGYTQNYLKVRFKSSEKDLINHLVNVKIKSIEDDMLIGEKEM